MQVIFNNETTGGLGELILHQPPGTFALTPASRIALQAVGQYRHWLQGKGLDWGCGNGCLGIAAATIPTVTHVIGLDINPANVAIAAQNASLNGVGHKTTFLLADSYTPYHPTDQQTLAAFAGQTGFILANPPSSEGDDGFAFRRLVLRGARTFLLTGGVVFLSISYQYGPERIQRLCQEIPGFSYDGVLTSTDWVPFDLQRPDLDHCLELYVEEEQRGGDKYSFGQPESPQTTINAQTALADYQRSGRSPLTRWQTHLFRFTH